MEKNLKIGEIITLINSDATEKERNSYRQRIISYIKKNKKEIHYRKRPLSSSSKRTGYRVDKADVSKIVKHFKELDKNKRLEKVSASEVVKLKEENERLKKENEKLKLENADLKEKKEKLYESFVGLTKRLTDYTDTFNSLLFGPGYVKLERGALKVRKNAKKHSNRDNKQKKVRQPKLFDENK